jgi:negative regulator of sigma E activity
VNTTHDPIERLREAFESIVPAIGAAARWSQAIADAEQRVKADLAEPAPWRLVAGLAAAAAVSLAVLLPISIRSGVDASPLEPVASTLEAMAARHADSGEMNERSSMSVMNVHVPSTGIGWRMHWEAITSAFLSPIVGRRSAAGT